MILLSIVFFSLFVKAVLLISRLKPLRAYEEWSVVAIGAAAFMYISWLVIYMANINPFIEPVFIKNKMG